MAITQIRKEQISSVDPTTLSAAVPVNKGGTGLTSVTGGDVLYASADGVISAAATGSTSGVQAHADDLDNLSSMQTGASAALAVLTSTEVEILDGATVTTAELNILDGATVTTAELNILSGATVDSTELNLLDGITAIDTDLESVSASDDTLASAKAIKSYVDAVAAGLSWKESVRAASTEDAGDDIDLTATTLSPAQLDGVTLSNGDRVLLKDQSSAPENGIYVATTAADPSTWVRADDMDGTDEFAGTAVFVQEGTKNADQGYVCITNGTVTVGTTNISFTQFTGTGAFNFGVGLVADGNNINTSFANVTRPESNFASSVTTANTASPSVNISHRKLDEADFGTGKAPQARDNDDGARSELMFNAYLNGLLLNGKLTDDGATAEDIVDLLSGNGPDQDANITYDFVAVITELSSEFEFYMQADDLSTGDLVTFVYANNK